MGEFWIETTRENYLWPVWKAAQVQLPHTQSLYVCGLVGLTERAL